MTKDEEEASKCNERRSNRTEVKRIVSRARNIHTYEEKVAKSAGMTTGTNSP